MLHDSAGKLRNPHVAADNERRLSNHNGVPRLKVPDGSNSQIWETISQGSGYYNIVSRGSTNAAGINNVLGVEGQGSSVANLVNLQGGAGTDAAYQLWDVSAMTGNDQGRYKLVRKGTSLRIGGKNWGAGTGDLNSNISDLELADDPDNTFGSNKWIKTSVSCPGVSPPTNCSFTASLSASNSSPTVGQSVTLTSGCSGNDCSGLSYTWSGQGASGSGSTTTFNAPSPAGSYTYSVTISKSGCSTSQSATVTLNVQAVSSGNCYTLAPASYVTPHVAADNERRLSNHNGVPRLKVPDGSNSQIWETISQGSGYYNIVSRGSTNAAGINNVLGVEGQGSSVANLVNLQGGAGTDAAYQLWDVSAMTGNDQGRYKLVRKGTSLRIGGKNWGAGTGDLNSNISDLELADDPDNTFGSNKWIKTSVGCPTTYN